MASKNYGLELYKLITSTNYVSEFGWVSDTEFFVWVNNIWFSEFVCGMIDIFGYGIFDDENFNANIQSDCVCIDLTDVLDGLVDIEGVFLKDKYKH